MIVHSLKEMRDFFYARLCYQIFITPIPFPLEKQYRDFAERACEFVLKNRSELIIRQTPRHHAIHRFAQPHTTNARKVLITHGWMSRAAYMVKLIRALHKQGYDVYALDFPAHGEAKGFQLPWTDAVMILQNVINTLGPFYAVIGHSFGGSMLLNTLNLACQFPEWKLDIEPERVVLIASPTRMRTPVSKLARRFWLKRQGIYGVTRIIPAKHVHQNRTLEFQTFCPTRHYACFMYSREKRSHHSPHRVRIVLPTLSPRVP